MLPKPAAVVRIDCSVGTDVLPTANAGQQTDVDMTARGAKRARTPDGTADCGGSSSGGGVAGRSAALSDPTGRTSSYWSAKTGSADSDGCAQPSVAWRTSGGWGCAPWAGAPALPLHLARTSQSLLRAAYADPRAHALLYADFADGTSVSCHGLPLPPCGATLPATVALRLSAEHFVVRSVKRSALSAGLAPRLATGPLSPARRRHISLLQARARRVCKRAAAAPLSPQLARARTRGVLQARFARMAAGQCDVMALLDPLALLIEDTLAGPDRSAKDIGVTESALALLLALVRVCTDSRDFVRQQWLTSQNEASITEALGASSAGSRPSHHTTHS